MLHGTTFPQREGGQDALGGLVVVDMTRILAGPYATQILGDLGAEVIKVERPLQGDDGRRFGAHALPDAQGRRTDKTSFHLAANRNKRSITLNFGQPEGREILLGLIARCDVLVENFRSGTLARHGLDYATLRHDHPGLIYCSITGYGQDGPYAARPGYDGVFQAQSGLMSITGPAFDVPGSKPYKAGPSIVDVITGMNAATAVLAALQHRHRTGAGQHIDVALLDSAIALSSHAAMEYLISGEVLPRMGNEGNGGAPANAYACADGHVYISTGTEAHYRRLCRTLGIEGLVDEPCFASSQLRHANRHRLNAIIEGVTERYSMVDLVRLLDAAEVPAGAVNDFAAVFADPQVRHRGNRVMMCDGDEIPCPVIASPLRMSASPPSYRRTPPGLGEHTDEILRDMLHLDTAAIRDLRESGVI